MSETGPGPDEEELAVWQPYKPDKPRSRTELPAISEAAMADPDDKENVRRGEIAEATLSGELKPRKARAELWRQKNVADANEHWRKTMNPATPEEQAEQDRYNERRATNMAEAKKAAEDKPPGIWAQSRADRKTHREEKAREAVAEAAAKVPEGPERVDITARVEKYVEELERAEVFARVNGGISTVEIDNPDDELRQALYEKFGVREAEIWYNETDQPKPKVWQGLMSTAGTPMRAVRYAKQRMTGLRPSEAAGSHFEVRRFLVGSDNETVIEESWLQLQARVKGDGKPGDMSLASTRLIRVEGGAYEEKKGDKLVASKAMDAYQKLPRTKIPGMYQDLEPLTDAELPPEGPRPGSLPRDEVFPSSEAPVELDDEGAEEEGRLPRAPELRRPAVSPTPRPEDPVVPEQTTESATAAAPAAPNAEVKPPEPAAAGETEKETAPEPQAASGGSSEAAPTAAGPDSGPEVKVEAKPAGGESEPGETATAEAAHEKQPIEVLVSGQTQPPLGLKFAEEEFYESSEAAAVFGAVEGGDFNGYDRYAAQAAKTAVQDLLKRPLDINNAEAVLTEAGMKLDSAIRQDSRSRGKSQFKKGQEEREVLGQTTLAAVKFLEDGRHAGVLSVGDSRVYRMRGDVLVALTKDDDNFLGGRVGSEGKQIQDFQPNVKVTDVELGDRFILLTGGVHHNLSEQEIRTIVRGAGSPKEVSEQLLSAVTAKLSDYSGQKKAPLETSTADATVVSMFVRQPEFGVEPGGGEHAAPAKVEAPAPYVVEAPVRTEYSVKPGMMSEGEFTKFSETVHSIQDGDEAFGVAPSGQLLKTQVERLVDASKSKEALNSIKFEITERGEQERAFQRRLAASRGTGPTGKAALETDVPPQSEQQLLAMVEAQYGVLFKNQRAEELRQTQATKAESAGKAEAGSSESDAPEGSAATFERPAEPSEIRAELNSQLSAARTRRELFEVARQAATRGLVKLNADQASSRRLEQRVSPLGNAESENFYDGLREVDTDITSYGRLNKYFEKVKNEPETELGRVKAAFAPVRAHEMEIEWTPEAVEAVLDTNPTSAIRNDLSRQLIAASHLLAQPVEGGKPYDLMYAGTRVRLAAVDEVGEFALENMKIHNPDKRPSMIEPIEDDLATKSAGEPEPEIAAEVEPSPAVEEGSQEHLEGVYDNLAKLLNGLGDYADETEQSDELYRLAGLAVENGLVEADRNTLSGVKGLSNPSSNEVGRISELFASGIEQMAHNLLGDESFNTLDIPESDAVRAARAKYARDWNRRGRRGGSSGGKRK